MFSPVCCWEKASEVKRGANKYTEKQQEGGKWMKPSGQIGTTNGKKEK